jgi:hypothetical protein
MWLGELVYKCTLLSCTNTPHSVATEFAVEVPCNGIANVGRVYGAHANWYYMNDNEYYRFVQQSYLGSSTMFTFAFSLHLIDLECSFLRDQMK